MTDYELIKVDQLKCPHCGNDNKTMLSIVYVAPLPRFADRFYCDQCSKEFIIQQSKHDYR